MDANLDLLLTIVYCHADDFLPRRVENARRTLTDTEIITLCVAQALLGIPVRLSVHRDRRSAVAAPVPDPAIP